MLEFLATNCNLCRAVPQFYNCNLHRNCKTAYRQQTVIFT